MKNLILLFGLVLIFSCRKKEKDFPRTLEELIDFENQRIEKELAECDSDIAKQLCNGFWFAPLFLSEGYSSSTLSVYLKKDKSASDNQEFKFDCNKTWFRKKNDWESTLWSWWTKDSKEKKTWHLNFDTLSISCLQGFDDHKYIISKRDSLLHLRLIDKSDSCEGGPFGKGLIGCIEWGSVPIRPNILPYLDSLNSSK